MRRAGSGALESCIKAHLRHQPTDRVASNGNAFLAQIGSDLAAEEPVSSEVPVDLFHHLQCAHINTDGRVVEGRPA